MIELLETTCDHSKRTELMLDLFYFIALILANDTILANKPVLNKMADGFY